MQPVDPAASAPTSRTLRCSGFLLGFSLGGELYARGALLVSNSALAMGCFGWSRPST